ncbi:MAG TPA: zinc carboxypeptidase, partial [Cytophagales bacterium]|nr:zinc carboxypeptidase [Cytophagales bacterium]
MKRFLLVALLGLLSVPGWTQIQSPSEFLGYPLGSQFTYHHRVVAYYEHVAANSDRVKLEYYGQTNERRPLLVAYITSPENHGNLESIQADNVKRSMVEEADSRKAIVWLSYNVHGNEASATEASLLTLYTLASTQDVDQVAWLNNSVVVMDPCINPDGRDRYANWYNQIGGFAANANPDAWEHNEPWPGGRPNHYLFDLNRDWAWQTQVESQTRMALYQKWMPHVHVDFHEQFINSPYYFAPAAEPFHDLITDFQRDFQTRIGQNHARYFDEEGRLYFTREVFDLLYPSYGDTYPTFNGSIGMTYEQAGHGMAGLSIDNEGKDTLTLLERLTHHHTTGLSTIEVSSKNADELIDNFGKFFQDQAKGVGSKYKTYVVPAKDQMTKGNALIDFLKIHNIDYWIATGNKNVEGFSYRTNRNEKFTVREGDLIVPANQPRGGLVRALFEPNTQLSTPITYDITAWSLPYVYGLNAYAVESTMSAPGTRQNKRMSTGVEVPPFNPDAPYGYILAWEDLRDAQVLAGWLNAGLQVRFSEMAFTQGGYDYPAGSIIVLRSDNPDFPGDAFGMAVQKPLKEHRRVARETKTGW